MSRVHKLSLGLLMAAVAWQVAGNAIDTAMAQDAGAEGTESGMAPAAQTDPLIERGGCLITSARSTIDARLDTRLARVIAGLLEDERATAG